MRLTNIFPQFARNSPMRFFQQQTATLFLIIPESLTKGFISPRQMSIKRWRFWINLVNLRQLLLDKISARLVRENTDLICIPISKIFNSSLTSGVFPNDGECAKVTPLLNQGSPNDMNNYRPRQILYLWGDQNIRKSNLRSLICVSFSTQHDPKRTISVPFHSTVTALL